MSPELLSGLAFLVVTGVLVAGYYISTARSPIEERLKQMVSESGAESAAKVKRGELVGSTLDRLGGYGVGGPDRSLAHRLSVAGYRGPNATTRFLGLRTLVSFGPAIAVLVLQISAGRSLGRALGGAGAVWAVGHFLVNLRLKQIARKRQQDIVVSLPDMLDLMVVCLEAGLGLNATIARLGDDRMRKDDPLAKEVEQVSLELRSGRSREDSLRTLGDRNGVDDLKTLVALMIQCDRLGASMGKTLRSHADMLRTKRRQRAEEAARKLPIKMLVPLALFVLPPLFTMTVGPAILQIMTLFKGMGN